MEVQLVSIMEIGLDLNWSVTLTIGQEHRAESQSSGRGAILGVISFRMSTVRG